MPKSISTKLTTANIMAVMNILTETPHHLTRLSAGLSAEHLRQPLGAGERSFTEDMAHLINCERISESMYLALLVDEPLILDIHPERQWGKLLRHEGFEFADLLAYFKFRRMILVRVLHALSEEQWSRTVREAGKQRQESVYWKARTMALHELEHVTDLEIKLPKLKGE